MDQPPAPRDNQQIQIRDGFSGGEYANMMNVGFTKEEFFMTFVNLFPPTARTVAKVMTSPGHLKRIIKALNESLRKYESAFGSVEEAESPKSEIGFRQ